MRGARIALLDGYLRSGDLKNKSGRRFSEWRENGGKNKPRCEGTHRGWNDLNDPGEFMQVPAQGGEAGDGSHRL